MHYRCDVHGTLSLPDNLSPLIKHPLMQRLRDIQQVDIVSMYFVGATHTRFAHSLGVAHLACRFLNCYQVISPYLRETVQAAALLHDVGHLAFSHKIEAIPAIQELAGDTERLLSLCPEVEHLVAPHLVEVANRKPHEIFGVLFAAEILHAAGYPDSTLNDVLLLMRGETLPASALSSRCHAELDRHAQERFGRTSTEIRTDLARHLGGIISSPFDADRLDYVMRDCRQLSPSHFIGRDVSICLQSLSLKLAENGNGVTLSCANEDMFIQSLSTISRARAELYREIYHQPEIVGLGLRLVDALNEQFTTATKPIQIRKLTDLALLTDSYLWSRFREAEWQETARPCAAKRLLQREGYKVVELDNASTTSSDGRRFTLNTPSGRPADMASHIQFNSVAIDGPGHSHMRTFLASDPSRTPKTKRVAERNPGFGV